jgi:hypothetical protein
MRDISCMGFCYDGYLMTSPAEPLRDEIRKIYLPGLAGKHTNVQHFFSFVHFKQGYTYGPYSMKKTTTLICFLLAAMILHGQTNQWSVKGILIDSATHLPIPFATVSLKNDSVAIQPDRVTSDINGLFEWKSLSFKPGAIEISSSGYRKVQLPILNAPLTGGVINFGNIFMVTSSKDLKEVIVTGTKPLVKQEIDRLSYDVQADPESKALTVMELLRKVPLISVDGDDNVQLQGSTSFRIFINGRPSTMMASNMKDALRAIPAGTVQKIEVITTPPAKYDSEGLAGIINIIMSKKTDNGINTTINTRYTMPFGWSINATSVARLGRWGLSASTGTSFPTDVTVTSSNLRQTFQPHSIFQQTIYSTTNRRSWFANGEISFEADSLNLFTLSLYRSEGRLLQNDRINTEFNTDAPDGKMQQYKLKNDLEYPWLWGDLSFNYQRNFKNNPLRMLTISYRFSNSGNDMFTQSAAFDKQNYFLPDNRQWNDASLYENTFQVDYVHPFKKITMEAGVKAILRNNQSVSTVANLRYDGNDSSYANDPSRGNDFQYQQDVLSAYNTYNWKQGAYTVKAGLRFEQTLVSADFRTTATKLNTQFGNLTPSLSIMRTLSGNQSITFGFSSRIERPGIWLLNPFEDRSNPQMISKGNPALKSVQSYQGEVSYLRSAKGSLNIRTSYFISSGAITSVVRVLSDTLSETTYDNIGKNSTLRLSINGNYPIGKFTLNFNTGAFYVWVSGPYNGRFFSNHGIRTNTFVNLSYRPGKNWTIGTNAGYNRRYITLQGSSDDYAYYSVSSSKAMFDKKLSFTLIVSNFAKKHNPFTQYSATPDFYQSNTRNSIYRNIAVALSYKFGKQTGAIKKNKRGISNDDVSGGASQ